MYTESSLETQLKEAVQLSGAIWAAMADRVGGEWLLRAAYHLSKSAQTELMSLLARPSLDAWLCGSLSGGNVRSTSLPTNSRLGTERCYSFPVSGGSQTLLVGADDLPSDAQRLWKLTASLFNGNATGDHRPFLPDLESGLAFDLTLAVEKILTAFVQSVACQGAWLALRRGESLDIQAEWNDPKAKGVSLLIDSNPILRRVNRTLSRVAIQRGQPNWDNLPFGALKPGTKMWICLPLVVGQRMIGVIAMWRQKEFEAGELGQLQELALRAASSIEVVVTFSETTTHLRRLGMLNDFVLTVSSAQNLDQIARRVFGLLFRAFNTELISLYLRSSDGRILRDYHMLEGKLAVISVALADHLVQPYLKDGLTVRISDSFAEEYKPVHASARSALIVPMKYRGSVIGILVVENPKPEAFSQYDEHLMMVISSHLAGLIEYSRLREEAEGRARSLSLIHEVIPQVISQTNKAAVAQITADLLAQYFKYELATILLLDSEGNYSIQGMGGTQARLVKENLGGENFIRADGVTGRVARTGESILVNDTSTHNHYRPVKGWDAGSEICVAIKDGDSIMGIIDVESRNPNGFTHNDLIALESLAGILASVITSANQYQWLQETIRQLKITEKELVTRMEAQRSAENRLIQAAKLAAVGEMAAGIAHELNNPLTTVTGFSELLLEDATPDSEHREEMEMILREARRASDVVRRLLDFSRHGEPVRTSADLNEIVKDVIALSRHLITTGGVQLTVALMQDLPWVSIDRNQMKQVLLNLIHNALQAMPEGGSLGISTRIEERENREWVTMSVQDSGHGIQPQDRDRIFEPFFTTKGDRGGTGLGLSVTYGIITDHGGTIEVLSEINQGSTFVVWLPL
jgi:signal transduction histidine kinase